MNPQLNESANKSPIFPIGRDMVCLPFGSGTGLLQTVSSQTYHSQCDRGKLFQIDADLRGADRHICILKNGKVKSLLVAKLLIKDAFVNAGALGDGVDAGTVYAFGGDFGCGGRASALRIAWHTRRTPLCPNFGDASFHCSPHRPR
jgi:hypothetical protein